MNTLSFGRFALCISAAALLSACGGSPSIPTGGPSDSAAFDRTTTGAKTFHYAGREQAFLVPKGVRQIIIVARGAAGGGDTHSRGGRVHGVIRVRTGEILYVFVGGQASSTTGGYNGGASGGYGSYCRNCPGFGGGGASDVREVSDHLSDRILVVGGGGGEGGINPYGYKEAGAGGRGGGETGGAGGSASGSGCGGYGGGGGSQYDDGLGGAGGSCFIGSGNFGQNGSLGSGGAGGQGGYAAAAGGGGGGGGYYGGGGGGAGSAYNSAGQGSGGGGGGGSSWAKSNVADFETWAGWKNATGDGLVVFSW